MHIPDLLVEEVLRAAAAKHRGNGKRRYVIDLFAGAGSLAPVVGQLGYAYVPVDIDISKV